MKYSLATVVFGGFFLAAISASAQPSKVLIFIGPQIRDGFVDADREVRDAIADLQRETRHFKRFKLAPDAAEADIILRVKERHVGRNPDGSATLISFHVLSTVLEVGDYRKDFQVAVRGIGGEWRECAEQIMKQLDAWAEANAVHISVRQRN